MGYSLKIQKDAREDLFKLKDAHLNNKFDELITIIRENPFQVSPPYEKLVGVPYYSRRINIIHRLVYRVIEEEHTIIIQSVWSHYERRLN